MTAKRIARLVALAAATLVSASTAYGAGNTNAAIASIDKLAGPEWYPIFKDLHAGMILELANKQKDAGVRFERAYKLDESALRVSDAYARWLSRNRDAAAAAAARDERSRGSGPATTPKSSSASATVRAIGPITWKSTASGGKPNRRSTRPVGGPRPTSPA